MKRTSNFSVTIGSHELEIFLHFPHHEKVYSSLEYKIVKAFVSELFKEKTLSPFQVTYKAHVYNILPLTEERILSPELLHYDYHLFCHEKPSGSCCHVGTQFSSDNSDGHTALSIPNRANASNQEPTDPVQSVHSALVRVENPQTESLIARQSKQPQPPGTDEIQPEPVRTEQPEPGPARTEQPEPEPARTEQPEPESARTEQSDSNPVQQQCVDSESEQTDMVHGKSPQANTPRSSTPIHGTPDEFDSLTDVLEVMDFDAARKSLNFGEKYKRSYTTMTMVTKLQSLDEERRFSVDDCISDGRTAIFNRISIAQSALNATENVEIDIPSSTNDISIEVAKNSEALLDVTQQVSDSQSAQQSAEQLRENDGVSVNERSTESDAAETTDEVLSGTACNLIGGDPDISTDLIELLPEIATDSQDTQADLEAEDTLVIVEDESEEIPHFGTQESHDSGSHSTPMSSQFYDSRDRFSAESSSQESSYVSPSCSQDVANICLEHLDEGTAAQYRKMFGSKS